MFEYGTKPLVFLVFCLLPDGVHLLEGGVFGLPEHGLKTSVDRLDAADEFPVRSAKRVVRVELQTAGEGAHRERQIAAFLRTLGGLT